MLERLYGRTLALAQHRRAMGVLGAVSFTESSFFPIPPDLLMVPMILADRRRAWRIALVATATSVAGGLFGYAIGMFLYEAVGRPIVEFFHLEQAFADFEAGFAQWGLWIILIKGLTPVPYKLVTIASGVAHFDLFTFVWASILTRGARFFLVAALLWRFGDPVRSFIEKRLGWTLLGLLALILALIALFAWIG